MRTVLLALLLLSSTAFADLSGGGLIDYYGNGVTSQLFGGTRNSLDVETVVSGTVVDPRARTWTLGSATDFTTVVQGTSPWVSNISQFGGANVVTGLGVSGSGIPRFTISSDSSLILNAGSNIIGNVRIDQTTPGTTNGVVVNSGSITANAGTNLNTSALALSATQTNGTQKNQVVDGSGNVQPSGDVAARKIFTATTDGTNTQAVKAASTAAASTDPGAVVVLSSNFPVLTASAGTAVSVGATSTATVASNTNRAGLILVNTSVQRMSCTVGTAVLNSGVSLFPGGTWTMDQYSFTTGAIACIAGAAASNISVQEFTK